MCLIVLAYQPTNSEYDLIVTANREEYYVRPTATANQWEEEKDTQHIIAGRDLQEGGTWLGIDTRRKRFAALTNNFLVVTQQEQEEEKKERHIQHQQQEQEVFDNDHTNDNNNNNNNNNNNSKQNAKLKKRSRGELVTNFLTSNDSAIQYSYTISKLEYRGYSLLLMDETGMYCVDNNNNNTNTNNSIQSSPFNTNKQQHQQPQQQPQCFEPGKVYGLTNRQLNCDWPKNIRGRKELETWLEKNHTTNDNNNHHNRQNDNSHNNNNNNNSENSIQENEKKNNTQNNDHATDAIIDHDVDKSSNNSTSIHELYHLLLHPTTNKSKNPNTANKEEEEYNYPDRIATDAFLTSEYYGTRVNTVVAMKSNGEIFFSEQGFGRKGVPTQTVQFSIPA